MREIFWSGKNVCRWKTCTMPYEHF